MLLAMRGTVAKFVVSATHATIDGVAVAAAVGVLSSDAVADRAGLNDLDSVAAATGVSDKLGAPSVSVRVGDGVGGGVSVAVVVGPVRVTVGGGVMVTVREMFVLSVDVRDNCTDRVSHVGVDVCVPAAAVVTLAERAGRVGVRAVRVIVCSTVGDTRVIVATTELVNVSVGESDCHGALSDLERRERVRVADATTVRVRGTCMENDFVACALPLLLRGVTPAVSDEVSSSLGERDDCSDVVRRAVIERESSMVRRLRDSESVSEWLTLTVARGDSDTAS